MTVTITRVEAKQIISLIFWHTKLGEPMAVKYRFMARKIAEAYPEVAQGHHKSLFTGWLEEAV